MTLLWQPVNAVMVRFEPFQLLTLSRLCIQHLQNCPALAAVSLWQLAAVAAGELEISIFVSEAGPAASCPAGLQNITVGP